MTFALRVAFFCAAVWFVLIAPSWAHDLDCKGQPVDRWTKQGCCGDADALLLGFDQVSGPDGRGAFHVIIDGGDHAVVKENGQPIALAPAKDGCYRVWYRREHLSKPPYPEDDPHGGVGATYHFFCLQGPLAI